MSSNSLSSQVPMAVCACSGRCLSAGLEWGRCRQHDIEMGETFGHHFCLKCEMYHCKLHYTKCCYKYGKSVMIRDSNQTLPQIRRRTQEIISEWESEVKKYEKWIEQIKTRRFICAECRQVTCECNLSNFKEYQQRKSRKLAKKLEKRMKDMDLQVV